ncbi:hypothetical protein J1N35_043684, partial [Gossypium stocksii]
DKQEFIDVIEAVYCGARKGRGLVIALKDYSIKNEHIMIDLGTDNNKINWALKDKQKFIDIIEIVYYGARKGRGLVISSKDYLTNPTLGPIPFRGSSLRLSFDNMSLQKFKDYSMVKMDIDVRVANATV